MKKIIESPKIREKTNDLDPEYLLCLSVGLQGSLRKIGRPTGGGTVPQFKVQGGKGKKKKKYGTTTKGGY